MADIRLFDKTMLVLEKALDYQMQKQQVIAANIANAQTPGYAPGRLDFEEGLKNALKSGESQPLDANPRHLPIGQGSLDTLEPRFYRDGDRTGMGDRNGVDLEQEMIDLAENQIRYEATTQLVKKKLGMLKYVVTDVK